MLDILFPKLFVGERSIDEKLFESEIGDSFDDKAFADLYKKMTNHTFLSGFEESEEEKRDDFSTVIADPLNRLSSFEVNLRDPIRYGSTAKKKLDNIMENGPEEDEKKSD